MALQPLTPAQALWQHYNVTTAQSVPGHLGHNPVTQRETYARLQAMGRIVSQTRSMDQLNTHKPNTASQNWQTTPERADEGLGLSEL